MSSQLQVSGEAKIRDIQGPVVANSGVITALDGAASQYVRGDGTLADFPTSSGGGSSVSYYLNSSVSQGTIGGVAYKELNKEPIIGAGTDIAIAANGYVANYITDANDPDVLSIPGGNFNCEFYFSVSNDTGNPFFYAELYKYDGTTFTLLGSSVGVPEYINQGTIIAPYYFAIPVPTSALAVTDRLAIRIYVNVDGRTVTLHTENSHLCQVVTTLSKGMVSLNNLTDQSQYLTTGTSGTDFNIVSSGDTHTFNIPSASASNRGLITTGAQTIAGSKTFSSAISADAGVLLKNGFTTYSNAYTSLSGDVGSLVISGSISSTPFDNVLAFAPLTSNTYTFPDVTGTIALLEGTQTFSGSKTFSTGIKAESGIFLKELSSSGRLTGYVGISATATGGMQQIQFLYPVSGSSVFSLPTTGAYNYEFPIVSGTIALTSDLSSYVPYTGATTNVNLGVYSLTANQLIAGGASTDNVATLTTYDQGHALKLKGSTGDLFFVPYFSPSIGARITAQNSAASANTPLSFYASNFYFNSNVNFGSTLGNGTYTYTLPSATGTLALTSNLSAYLPLTGGTLTGNLIINPSTTEYTLSVSTPSTNNTIKLLGSSAGNTSTIGYFSSNGATGYGALNFTPTNTRFEIVNSGSFSIYTSGIERFTVASGGTTTLTGALSGTSATFSGTISIGTNFAQLLPITALNSQFLTGCFYDGSNVIATAASGSRTIYNSGSIDFRNFTGATIGSSVTDTSRLLIASTGAATFSSSVTSNGFFALTTTSDAYATQGTLSWNSARGTVISGKTASVFDFAVYGAASQALITNPTGTSVISFPSGNVGIGTSSPSTLLHTYLANGSNDNRILVQQGSNGYASAISLVANNDDGGRFNYINSSTNGGTTHWQIGGSGSANTMAFLTGGTERMRITSAGKVLIGTTSVSAQLSVTGATSSDGITSTIVSTGNTAFVSNVPASSYSAYWVCGGNTAGYISHPSTTTTTYYTGPSDLRLKSNINEWDESVLDLFSKVKPKTYNHIADNDESIVYKGFIAQEMVDKFPEAYQKDRDGYYANNPTGFIPYLVKAIQESHQIIKDLEARIVTLESKLN